MNYLKRITICILDGLFMVLLFYSYSESLFTGDLILEVSL